MIGGGLSGMLAAAAAVPFADGVTMVECDALPSRAQPREGVPQGHHGHVTGVRVASRDGREWRIDAGLVVDAGGRHCRMVDWFAALGRMLEGLVVAGDAAATYHPAHGQGMSAAALPARALLRTPAGTGQAAPGLARRAQQVIARPPESSWVLTTAQHSTRGVAFSMVAQIRVRSLRRPSRAASSRSHRARPLRPRACPPLTDAHSAVANSASRTEQ
jgi:hypothetical protein